jgi:hypothetical protein
MQSIEQFKAEQIAAMEKATAAHAARLERADCFANAGFPIPEYIADGNLYGAIGVTYRNRDAKRNMLAAVELFGQFVAANTVIASHVLRNGSTIIHPEQYMPARKNYKRDTGRQSAPYAALLKVWHMGESHSTSSEIKFFAAIGGKLFNVSIQFGTDYIGKCDALAPHVHVSRDGKNRIQSREYKPNGDAYALADSFMSYSFGGDFGPIKTGADHRFLFVADHDETGPVECSHALAQLTNLAEIVKG